MKEETVTAQPDTALRQRVFDSIGLLLPKVLDRETGGVSDSTQLMSELGLRSATMLELLLELEEDLEVQIDVEDIDRGDMNTVGDLANFVAAHATTDD
jgi:acyl carrier protein